MLSSAEIQKILPHRYPFLLVDRIDELEPGVRAKGVKCVSVNEPFFQGHFPGNPIMPGVLIVEALAQVGAVAILVLPENKNKLALFARIDDLRFKQQVLPGDVLDLEVEIVKVRGPIGKGMATATVRGQLAARGELTFALIEKGTDQ
jgi:3-hydroxyacyl-[acyl-carrier-protein] dehydratase